MSSNYYHLLPTLLVLVSLILIKLWWKICRPPVNFRGLPYTPTLSTLYTFMTVPILDAMRQVYWPILSKCDVMVTWFLGDWWVVISDPKLIKEILNDQSLVEKRLYTDLSPNALVGEYIGVNLLYSKGEDWRRHRKVINPAFKQQWSPELFANCCSIMLDQMKLESQRIETGGFRVDIHDLTTRMTLDALGDAVLGFQFDATKNPHGEYTVAYHRAANAVSNNLYFLFPFLESLPIPSRIKDRQAVRDFRSLAQRIIENKRQTQLADGKQCKSTDLLSLMLKTDENNLLSDKELINDTIIMFAAGHDTTANTICFILYHLCQNPSIQADARASIFDILSTDQSQPPKVPDHRQSSLMVYLDAISYETMRLTPALPQMRRELKVAYRLPTGQLLPPGTSLLLQTYTAMNHPDYWDRPDQFRPHRFLLPSPTDPHRYTLNREALQYFFGFGGGTRTCIGYQMSLLEQKVTLCMILQQYHLRLPPHSPHRSGLVTTQDQLCRPLGLTMDFLPLHSI